MRQNASFRNRSVDQMLHSHLPRLHFVTGLAFPLSTFGKLLCLWQRSLRTFPPHRALLNPTAFNVLRAVACPLLRYRGLLPHAYTYSFPPHRAMQECHANPFHCAMFALLRSGFTHCPISGRSPLHSVA